MSSFVGMYSRISRLLTERSLQIKSSTWPLRVAFVDRSALKELTVSHAVLKLCYVEVNVTVKMD